MGREESITLELQDPSTFGASSLLRNHILLDFLPDLLLIHVYKFFSIASLHSMNHSGLGWLQASLYVYVSLDSMQALNKTVLDFTVGNNF